MSTQPIDFDSLAKQHGGTAVDYDALAAQHGGSGGSAQQYTGQDFTKQLPQAAGPHITPQPMSVSDTINAATGHEGYHHEPITPLGLAQGTAQDIKNLSVLTPLQMLAKRVAGRPVLGTPPSPEQLTQSAVNTGTAMALGMAEGGAQPATSRPATAPKVETPPAPTYQRPTLTPEQQVEFTKQIDKVNKPFAKYTDAQDLASRKQQQAAVVQQDVKTLNNRVYGQLSQQADAIRDQAAPVITKPALDAIETAKGELSGVPADLRVFQQITHALQQMNAEQLGNAKWDAVMRGEEGAFENLVKTPTTEVPAMAEEVPFADAWRQYTALNNAWADATGNIKRALGIVRDAYGKELQAAAERGGVGTEFSQVQKGFANYYRDFRSGPINRILKARHPDYVTPEVTGKPGNLLRETVARYGDPASIQRLQETANPAPPTPPPVTPPPPAPVKPGFVRRHVIPKLGGAVAATANVPIPGHYLINYAAGQEAATALANRLTRPPTPEAYIRQTMEDAKNGRISPGEADRRVSRAGGRVKIRPIPHFQQQERE